MMVTTERLVLRPWREERRGESVPLCLRRTGGPRGGMEAPRVRGGEPPDHPNGAVPAGYAGGTAAGTAGGDHRFRGRISPPMRRMGKVSRRSATGSDGPSGGRGSSLRRCRSCCACAFMELGAARVWCGHSRGMTSPAASSRSAGSPMFATGPPCCGLTGRSGLPATMLSPERTGRGRRGMGEFRVPFQAAGQRVRGKAIPFHQPSAAGGVRGDARAFIAQIKKQYYDARHNCWCYLIGGERGAVQRRRRAPGHSGTAHAQRVPAGERYQRGMRGDAVLRRHFAGSRRADTCLFQGGAGRSVRRRVRGDGAVGRGGHPVLLCAVRAGAAGGRRAGRHSGRHQYGADIHLTVSLPEESGDLYKNGSLSCPPEASGSRCCRRSSARGRGRSFEHLCRNAGEILVF